MMALISAYPWPSLNAFLNGISAILLVMGYGFIRRGQIPRHRVCMGAAFITSTIFLVSYLAYHARAGHVHFLGTGTIRTVYFVILGTHTVLAGVIVPLILRTLFLALKGRFVEHKRWARWTLPLWFYVSVTGVVVYWMLYGMGNAAI
jgi:putative membrane protein